MAQDIIIAYNHGHEAFARLPHRIRLRIAEVCAREWVNGSVEGTKDGTEATHVEWQCDEYLPNYVPAVGSRIFVDMTPTRARLIAGKRYDVVKEDQEISALLDRYGSRENFIDIIAFSILTDHWPHTPMIVEVTEEIRNSIEIKNLPLMTRLT